MIIDFPESSGFGKEIRYGGVFKDSCGIIRRNSGEHKLLYRIGERITVAPKTMVFKSFLCSRINKGPAQLLHTSAQFAVKADLPDLRIKAVNESIKNSGKSQVISSLPVPGKLFLGMFAKRALFLAEGIVVMGKEPPAQVFKTFLRMLQHGS